MENPIIQIFVTYAITLGNRDVVWLLEATDESTMKKTATFTGLCVGAKGLVMVGESMLLNYFENATFKARRVDDEALGLNATRLNTGMWGKKLGVALFKVQGVEKCNVGKFAKDESLKVGQTLVYLGHPGDLVWSLIPTTVAYNCVGGVQVTIEDGQTCATYKYEALIITPEYRKLGHIYNALFFTGMGGEVESIYGDEMKRHPEIPVIQCNGLLGCVDCGGPLFNLNGEVVGLLSVEFKCFTFAIHASALDQFLTSFTGKGKGISPKSTMESTKKRKKV